MKIISSFKDYYDYVAYMYGGGDPRVIYNRSQLRDSSVSGIPVMFFPWERRRGRTYRYKYLIICARYYLLVSEVFNKEEGGEEKSSPYQLLTRETYPELYRYVSEDEWRGRKDVKDWFLGNFFDERLVELSRAVDAPVFIISRVGWNGGGSKKRIEEVELELKIPKLYEYGIPSLISPESMYGELSYFVGNVMRVSPDLAPPVQVEEQYRVEQAGFDLKTSFRHPVK